MKVISVIGARPNFMKVAPIIKEFRKLTNHNPKDFFKVTNKVDGDKLVWEIK